MSVAWWRFGVAVGGCGLLALLSGCADRSIALFEPDWHRVLERNAKKDDPELDIPAPDQAVPSTLPDFEGEGPVEVSVEQAVFLALRSNRDLSVAQLDPVVTGAFEKIARGRFDPEVFGAAEFTREEATETARATGEQFSVSGDESAVEAGVRQDLPSGTNVEVGVDQARSISDRAPEQQTSRVGLTVNQALLRGYGPAVNLVAIRQAELDSQASRFELRGFVEALLAETEIAYWQFVLAKKEIAIFERSLEIARQQSDEIAQRIEVGVLAETESWAALTEVAIREQALIGARRNLRAAMLQLLRQVDAPSSAGYRDALLPTTEPSVEEEPVDNAADRVRVAKQRRADLQEARLRLEQNRLETVRTRNGLLPRLDVFVALEKTGYGDTFVGSFEDLDGPGYDATVGVSLSQSLERLAAEGEHEAAVASRLQAAAAIQNLEQVVELDVQLALNELLRAQEQMAASTTTRELQEQTVQAEIERFNAGTSTTLLVAQAQRDLLQAQINEVESLINYRIALVRLYLAEGTLLERRGVRLEPNGG